MSRDCGRVLTAAPGSADVANVELALKRLRQHAEAVQPALIPSDSLVTSDIAWKRAWARQLPGHGPIAVWSPHPGWPKLCTQSTLWHRSLTCTSSVPTFGSAVKRKRRDSSGVWHTPRFGSEAGCCGTLSSCLTTHMSRGRDPGLTLTCSNVMVVSRFGGEWAVLAHALYPCDNQFDFRRLEG